MCCKCDKGLCEPSEIVCKIVLCVLVHMCIFPVRGSITVAETAVIYSISQCVLAVPEFFERSVKLKLC